MTSRRSACSTLDGSRPISTCLLLFNHANIRYLQYPRRVTPYLNFFVARAWGSWRALAVPSTGHALSQQTSGNLLQLGQSLAVPSTGHALSQPCAQVDYADRQFTCSTLDGSRPISTARRVSNEQHRDILQYPRRVTPYLNLTQSTDQRFVAFLAVLSTGHALSQLEWSRILQGNERLAVPSTGHALSQHSNAIVNDGNPVLAVPSTGHALSQRQIDVHNICSNYACSTLDGSRPISTPPGISHMSPM